MSTAVANYNQLVQQQRDLTKAIEESLKAIVAALENKLQLATQQKSLQAEIPVSYPSLSIGDVRRQVVDQILRRLEGRNPTQLRDWSCRLAQSGGNLED